MHSNTNATTSSEVGILQTLWLFIRIVRRIQDALVVRGRHWLVLAGAPLFNWVRKVKRLTETLHPPRWQRQGRRVTTYFQFPPGGRSKQETIFPYRTPEKKRRNVRVRVPFNIHPLVKLPFCTLVSIPWCRTLAGRRGGLQAYVETVRVHEQNSFPRWSQNGCRSGPPSTLSMRGFIQ